MKGLYTLVGDFITRNEFTLNNGGITDDGTAFTFPLNSTLNHLISVKLNQEMSYDDISFKFKLGLSDVTSDSRVGICLKSATDNYDGEKSMFVIGDGKVAFYNGNTKLTDYWLVDINDFNNKDIIVEMRRKDDTYYFTFNGVTVSKQVVTDNPVYRQNIKACIYGSSIDVEIKRVQYYTEAEPIKFGLLGDSIVNGYTSGGGGWTTGIKGINVLENELAFGEFAGSANVIKDSIDSIRDLALIRPKYMIIMYGHNDILFATGRLESDYKILVRRLQDYGITPIICTMPYSNWIDITPANTFIQDTYFNSNYITIDLSTTLTYPGDYLDIVHPNTTGRRKLANAIYNVIKNLP